jgi:GAF domain-containing protein
VGVLGFHRPIAAGPWKKDEVAAVEAVSSRLAFATDNLRLLEETQRRAAREQMTRQIADRMRRAPDLDTLLQTTIQEMMTALGTPNAFVQFGVPSKLPDAGSEPA